MAQKQIAVSEEVHAKVAEIAGTNFRGMGDQVAYWAAHTCAHPLESREEVNIVVAPVHQAGPKSKTARVGKNQPYRGFFCSQCCKYVFTTPAESDAAVADAMNATLVGVAVD